MNVDEVIANIVRCRDEAAELNKRVDEIKQERAQYEAQLMEMMAEVGATQMGSKHGTAYMKIKQMPYISDWSQFSPILAQHPEILQKRLSGPAVKELLENEVEIPGLSFVEEFSISVTRK